jgi:hypothetical protein
MIRMIDAIDSLAKMTEIMLSKLKRNLETAEEKALSQERYRIKFEDLHLTLFRHLFAAIEFICDSIIEGAKRVTESNLRTYI